MSSHLLSKLYGVGVEYLEISSWQQGHVGVVSSKGDWCLVTPHGTSCGTIGTRSHSAASSASARSLSFSGLVRVGLGSAARLSARVAFQLAASTAFTGIPR